MAAFAASRPGRIHTNAGGPGLPQPTPRTGGQEVTIDPVTRVEGAGALAIHAAVDRDGPAVLDAHSQATVFRGYETVLQGRGSRDAVELSSRV